jgi:hypothetical protein
LKVMRLVTQLGKANHRTNSDTPPVPTPSSDAPSAPSPIPDAPAAPCHFPFLSYLLEFLFSLVSIKIVNNCIYSLKAIA